MKKSKLSVGLVTTFISALALTGCTNYLTAKSGSLLTYEGGDGTKYEIITDKMYEEYRKDSSIVSKFYDNVLEVLIRDEFKTGNKKTAGVKKQLATIEVEAANNVKAQHVTAQENASTNGTSYSEEWEKILDSNGVEDEDELLQKFIYEIEEETLEDWYYEANEEQLRKEWLGKDNEGKEVTSEVSSMLPYHVRHILVKVDGATNFVNGTVTKDQANLLKNVADSLKKGNDTFGTVAKIYSEDDGSAALYGDVGIMNNKASSDGSLGMVAEFQLGIYAYDAVLSGRTEVEYINNGLGISDTVKTNIKEISLKKVPYEVFDKLGEYADTTTGTDKHIVGTEDQTCVYPRNILWNKYLNRHEPFVITNNTCVSLDLTDAQNIDVTTGRSKEDINLIGKADGTIAAAEDGKCGFRHVDGLGLAADEMALTDEKGRVIIGVRSEYGIHLMVLEKSIFDNDLETYYTTLTPSDTGYPSDSDTYVKNISTQDKSEYNSRASTVKSAIKDFDSTYSYRLYEYLMEENEGHFNFEGEEGKIAADLRTKIQNYIDIQRENGIYDQEKGLSEAWKKYFELIELEDAARSNVQRMVPEGCIVGFKKEAENNPEITALYEKGGACYYGNK